MPLPLAPAVIEIQAAFVAAFHAQPAPAVTLTLALPPVEVKLFVVGEIEYVHGAPPCVTVNVEPAIVIVPVRELAEPFAVTA